MNAPTLGKPKVTLMPATSIKPRPIVWEWRHYLARGVAHNLVGDGGHGKTAIAVDTSARITTGMTWADGTPNLTGPGDVVIAEAEGKGLTRVRLEKQGADISRVHFVTSDGRFTLHPTFLAALAERIRELPNPRLLLFSPLNSFLPAKIDTGNDAEMRRVLDPLTMFAEVLDIAVVSLLHPSKDAKRKAQHKALNSVAYINVPRITLATVAKPSATEGEPTQGRFGGIKFNEGPLAPTLSFSIDDDGLHWGERTGEDMRRVFEREVLKALPDSKLQQAKALLTAALHPDRVETRHRLIEQAEAQGISHDTVNRAKRDLPIKAEDGPGGVCQWRGCWPKSPTGESVRLDGPALTLAASSTQAPEP